MWKVRCGERSEVWGSVEGGVGKCGDGCKECVRVQGEVKGDVGKCRGRCVKVTKCVRI